MSSLPRCAGVLVTGLLILILAGPAAGEGAAAAAPGSPAGGWRRVLPWAVAAALAVMLWLSLGEANIFGFWTFAVLFFARVSAKLNLFFGGTHTVIFDGVGFSGAGDPRRGAAVATISSTRLSQAPHSGQRPIHLPLCQPQLWQV